jgi:hypothetical protein
MLRALVWRSNEGLPIKMGSVVTTLHLYYRNRVLECWRERWLSPQRISSQQFILPARAFSPRKRDCVVPNAESGKYYKNVCICSGIASIVKKHY